MLIYANLQGQTLIRRHYVRWCSSESLKPIWRECSATVRNTDVEIIFHISEIRKSSCFLKNGPLFNRKKGSSMSLFSGKHRREIRQFGSQIQTREKGRQGEEIALKSGKVAPTLPGRPNTNSYSKFQFQTPIPLCCINPSDAPLENVTQLVFPVHQIEEEWLPYIT